jgi:hypothetical protein
MAKVTVHKDGKVETPSESIVKAAQQPGTATDANGRRIGIRKLQALDRLKMFEVIGAENSRNEQYLGIAALAFSVASIDGEPVNRPASKPQLEALIQRLGDEGMEAVGQAVYETFAPSEE